MTATLPHVFAGLKGTQQMSLLDDCFNAVANPASNQTNVASPTAPASTAAYKMQGLAGAITPAISGNIVVAIGATINTTSTAAGVGIRCQVSYGTGAAPANAATLTGTQIGRIATYTNPTTVTAADVNQDISILVNIPGLTVGTLYWIDLAAESITTISVTSLTAVSVTSWELG